MPAGSDGPRSECSQTEPNKRHLLLGGPVQIMDVLLFMVPGQHRREQESMEGANVSHELRAVGGMACTQVPGGGLVAQISCRSTSCNPFIEMLTTGTKR